MPNEAVWSVSFFLYMSIIYFIYVSEFIRLSLSHLFDCRIIQLVVKQAFITYYIRPTIIIITFTIILFANTNIKLINTKYFVLSSCVFQLPLSDTTTLVLSLFHQQWSADGTWWAYILSPIDQRIWGDASLGHPM